MLVTAYSNPYLSQAVSLTGTSIEKVIVSGIDEIRINVTYPNIGLGYDSDFFNFNEIIDADHASQTVTLQSNSVVELYVGKVTVAIGEV